jgi:anthranilate/para-aminobenzoate synthase component II
MGIQHKSLPIAGSIIYLKYTHLILYWILGVQFHPESILTSPPIGLQIINNALKLKY